MGAAEAGPAVARASSRPERGTPRKGLGGTSAGAGRCTAATKRPSTAPAADGSAGGATSAGSPGSHGPSPRATGSRRRARRTAAGPAPATADLGDDGQPAPQVKESGQPSAGASCRVRPADTERSRCPSRRPRVAPGARPVGVLLFERCRSGARRRNRPRRQAWASTGVIALGVEAGEPGGPTPRRPRGCRRGCRSWRRRPARRRGPRARR